MLLPFSSVFSQSILQELEKDLQEFRLSDAEEKLASLEDAKLRAYYQCNILIYKYFSTQESKFYTSLDTYFDEAVEIIENSPADRMKEIFLSDLYGKRAVIAFLDHNYFQAIRYARNCHKLIDKSREKYGDDIEQMKIRGLFNALLGAIPRKYQWISNTLGYKGDIQQGRVQLETAAKESSYLRQEALFILYFVEKNMFNETHKSLARLQAKRKEIGGNILMDFILASGYLSTKNNKKALEVLNRRGYYSREGIFFIPYWDYLMGKAYYYKGSHALAQMYFSRFLKGYEGKVFKSDAYFRLAMSYALDGKYEEGRVFFLRIANGKKEGLDEDEYANFMAEKFAQKAPNPYQMTLFRARNLFDGGYLQNAISLLSELKQTSLAELSLEERTELYYRYGRIYQQEGRNQLALAYYEKCRKERESEQSWLQAYASYYSGEIKRKQAQLSEAKVLYKEALAYKDYFYQNGLENRCKIALSELKKELKNQASASNR
ncbi:MAG: tetratricopeptide repeat protein [Bacteroidia bacterium]|nr:tetratricopeptide repeat protein [Bacteroidia bacterium]